MRELVACTTCAEMVFAGSCVCPHCGHKYPCRSRVLPTAALMAGLTFNLTGCFSVEKDYGVQETGWYDSEETTDQDGDGYGTDGTELVDCDDSDADLNHDDRDGDGFTSCEDDCDDTNSQIHPEAEETPGDGRDSNCNGEDDT